jgi:hypothetical protein
VYAPPPGSPAQETDTFRGALDYFQTITGVYPGGGGVLAQIYVFTLPGSTVDVGSTPEDNLAALINPTGFPGYSELGHASYHDTSSTANGLANLAVTVNFSAGQTIWVDVTVQTPAPNGSDVNAGDTFITSWDDTSNLTPAAQVPEPVTLALLGVGLAGMTASRRRKTN